MLSKSQRIPRELFGAILESRVYSNAPHFSLRFASYPSLRVSVSVSKKVSKKATIRNTVRRRVYSIIRKYINEANPGLYLFIAKPGADTLKGKNLENEVLKLIKV
jgi:ribonuclease P protein component